MSIVSFLSKRLSIFGVHHHESHKSKPLTVTSPVLKSQDLLPSQQDKPDALTSEEKLALALAFAKRYDVQTAADGAKVLESQQSLPPLMTTPSLWSNPVGHRELRSTHSAPAIMATTPR